MRKQRLFIALALISILTTYYSKGAQSDDDKIKLSAHIRTRGEIDGRDFDNDTSAKGMTLLRVRLNAEFEATDDISGFIQLQDSRTYGAELNTLVNFQNVDLHQGYIQVEDFLIDDVTFKLGRMELNYANERLVGAVEWHNVGRAFDAALLSFEMSDDLSVELWSATLVDQANPTDVNDTGFDFGGVYAIYAPKDTYRLDLYVLGEWDRKESIAGADDLQRVTIGAYDRGKLGSIDYEVEAAGQMGKRYNPDNRKREDVAAFMLTGSIGFTADTDSKPRIAVGYDYLSGREQRDEDYKAFDTLFATNHKFYGFMDYFVNIPANTRNAGLQDLMAKFRVQPHKKLTLSADFHRFLSAKKINDESNFGQEIDLTAIYRYHQALNFTLGASMFLPDELMEKRFGGNDDPAFWLYLTTAVNL
jgi:hypothetical protein